VLALLLCPILSTCCHVGSFIMYLLHLYFTFLFQLPSYTCWLNHHVTTWSHRTCTACYGLPGASRPSTLRLFPPAGVYGDKHNVSDISAEDMLSVYKVNCVGPLLVVQQLMKAGHIGGFGGKTLVANVSSKVSSMAYCRAVGGVRVGRGKVQGIAAHCKSSPSARTFCRCHEQPAGKLAVSGGSSRLASHK